MEESELVKYIKGLGKKSKEELIRECSQLVRENSALKEKVAERKEIADAIVEGISNAFPRKLREELGQGITIQGITTSCMGELKVDIERTIKNSEQLYSKVYKHNQNVVEYNRQLPESKTQAFTKFEELDPFDTTEKELEIAEYQLGASVKNAEAFNRGYNEAR